MFGKKKGEKGKKNPRALPTIDVNFEAGWKAAKGWVTEVIALIPEVREKMKDIPDTNFRLALELRAAGKLTDAIVRLRLVLRLQPENAEAHYQLGACQFDLGFQQEALASFRKAVELKPDHTEAKFFMAMLGAEVAPEKAPHSVVRYHFEQLAKDYESVFVPQEHYNSPEQLHTALMPYISAELNYDVLDLGCGTGLCGEQFRSNAAFLRGVDISEAMLAQARERKLDGKKVYDSLLLMPLEDYLSKEAERNYDLVLAAAVFNYVGHIADTVRAVTSRLKPGGLFGFSVEKSSGDVPLILSPGTGRYRHSAFYVRKVAEEAGLEVLHLSDMLLYRDTPGLQAILKKRV